VWSPPPLTLTLSPQGESGKFRGPADRSPDRRISGAAAQVARDAFIDLLRAGVRMLRQQADDRHHKPWRAEPALKGVAFVERLLHGVERRSISGQSFDGRHLVAFGLDSEHEAGAHRRTVEQNRAAAAHTVLAADVRAGQAQVMAEVV